MRPTASVCICCRDGCVWCCACSGKRPRDSSSDRVRELLVPLLNAPRSLAELKAALSLPVGPLPVLDAADMPDSKDLVMCPTGDGAPAVLAAQLRQCFVQLPQWFSEMDLQNSFSPVLGGLLQWTVAMLGVQFDRASNVRDPTGATMASLRPDECGWVQRLLVWKAEYKKDSADFQIAVAELSSKMASPMPALFGQLPFVLACAVAGGDVQFFAVDPATRQSHQLSPVLSLGPTAVQALWVAARIAAVRLVLNMARVIVSWCEAGLLVPPKMPLYRLTKRLASEITLYGDFILKRWQPVTALDDLNVLLGELKDAPYLVQLSQLKESRNDGWLSARVQPVGLERMPATEEELRHALRCVLRALQFMHRRGIVHRDVRWPNIVVTDPQHGTQWVLADLDGVAREGTPLAGRNAAAPPEYVPGQPWKVACDIFQVGTLVLTVGLHGLPSPARLDFQELCCTRRPSADVLLAHAFLQ